LIILVLLFNLIAVFMIIVVKLNICNYLFVLLNQSIFLLVVWINNHNSAGFLFCNCNKLPIKLFLWYKIAIIWWKSEFNYSSKITIKNIKYFECLINAYWSQ